ncbi:hypothetical protein ACN9KL_04970 [Vagococcus fluvialis]|uniref:hypothetical protein n=1 Tax=Vagococcus fluvialis TaxID=2738 RepID=UPI003B21A251
MLKNIFVKVRKKETIKPYIKIRSNVIQYDSMGYPLRLVINRDDKQVWIDTTEFDGDIVLKWED